MESWEPREGALSIGWGGRGWEHTEACNLIDPALKYKDIAW